MSCNTPSVVQTTSSSPDCVVAKLGRPSSALDVLPSLQLIAGASFVPVTFALKGGSHPAAPVICAGPSCACFSCAAATSGA